MQFILQRRIWRSEDPNSSEVYLFSSRFFPTLDEQGPAAVSSWTAEKNIDIFSKLFVLIPIVENRTWSLCVIVNPGHIPNEYVEDADMSPDHDFPCILFLDPRKAHQMKRVARKVRRWLNYEAKRLDRFDFVGEPFNHKTMEVDDPKSKWLSMLN